MRIKKFRHSNGAEYLGLFDGDVLLHRLNEEELLILILDELKKLRRKK